MARDSRISDVFYYFEKHTTIASGRTVGRKIGVVQEILCKKLLLTSAKVRDCIIYEPKVPGRSGATHKVGFVLLQPIVAVTLSVGQDFPVDDSLSVSLISTDDAAQSAKIKLTMAGKSRRQTMKIGSVLRTAGSTIRFVSVNPSSLRIAVLDPSSPIASIESKRVGAQRFSGSNKLGSGIQTIEKAKQASLVAVDFDLKFNQTLLAQSAPKSQRAFKSFAVLGNGIHWTNHDLAILETYVDYTYLATDEAILRYADFIRQLAVKQEVDFFKYFMGYFQGMTKTPPDAFTFTDADFAAMRPINAGSFLRAVERQIKPYPTRVI